MFNIGDYVVNKNTGYLGKVIGYGHQMINNVYTTSLKVLVAEAENTYRKGFVVEDLQSSWTLWSGYQPRVKMQNAVIADASQANLAK